MHEKCERMNMLHFQSVAQQTSSTPFPSLHLQDYLLHKPNTPTEWLYDGNLYPASLGLIDGTNFQSLQQCGICFGVLFPR